MLRQILQHWAKTISSDIDVYQEEMISLRSNLHCNNYPECISSAQETLIGWLKMMPENSPQYVCPMSKA